MGLINLQLLAGLVIGSILKYAQLLTNHLPSIILDNHAVAFRRIINSHCYIENSSEDSMNKTDIIEIMSKRATKLAMLSVVFAGMLVFLVPALVEEADAIVKGKVTSTAGPFSNIRWHLDHGLWTITPRVDTSGNLIWETRGKGWPWPGHEDGTVWANVGGANRIVMFEFDSPPFGDNRCWATVLFGPLHSTCNIPRFGTVITATYTVTPRVQEDNGDSYCDILDKYGKETGVITEKLYC